MSSVWGMILQWDSTIKVSTELPVTSRHHRDMTEKLLKVTLNPKKTTTNKIIHRSINSITRRRFLMCSSQWGNILADIIYNTITNRMESRGFTSLSLQSWSIIYAENPLRRCIWSTSLKLFHWFSTETYPVGTYQNCLNEALQTHTNNIWFWWKVKNISHK